MARTKLFRFAHNAQASNVIQPGKEIYNQIKGKWRESYFLNENPLVIELACGRGEYTTGLAEIFPDKNFIGIDIKGARLWKGSSVAIGKSLQNVAFLRTKIQNLEDFFEENEVDEIWITFPDPRLRDRDERRRLTSPRFLGIYQKILCPKGLLHLKTDHSELFEYTLEILPGYNPKNLLFTRDLYQSDLLPLHYGIQTTYEKKFLESGLKINYLQFSF